MGEREAMTCIKRLGLKLNPGSCGKAYTRLATQYAQLKVPNITLEEKRIHGELGHLCIFDGTV